jgi:hypothetical protein
MTPLVSERPEPFILVRPGVMRQLVAECSPEAPRLRHEEPMGVARGIITGVALGVGIWGLLALAVMGFLRGA